MWESLNRLMEDVSYVNIDSRGSLKDFYIFALDNVWWQRLIDRLLDPELPIPDRPTEGGPRRSTRNHNASNQQSHNQQSHNQQSRNNSSENVSPPRHNRSGGRRNRSQRNDSSESESRSRTWRPENIGNTMWDSLRIFDLGYSASYAEVKAQYRSLASKYHPDKHSRYGGNGEGRTGMTLEETSAFFQHLNNAHEYLKEKLA